MNPISEIVVTYVTNALWMTCVITAVTVLLSRALRRGPSSHRHALWVAALLLAVLLPFASLRGSRNNDKPKPESAEAASTVQPTETGFSGTSSWHSGGECGMAANRYSLARSGLGLSHCSTSASFSIDSFASIVDGGHSRQCCMSQGIRRYRRRSELWSSNVTRYWA